MKSKKKLKIKKGPALIVGVALLLMAAGLMIFSSTNTKNEPAIKIYFVEGDKLVGVKRPLNPADASLNQAMVELLKGPSLAEKKSGIKTQIPAGARALNMQVKNRIATINFNRQLAEYGGGSDRINGIIAQIIYTATEIPGVDKVWIYIEGERELVLGGEGLVLDHPLGRADLAN